MRVLLMEPASPHAGRGNASTVARYAQRGRAAGHEVRCVTTASTCAESFELVHAHHAVRCGPEATALAAQHGVPLVISLGGTDLHGVEGEGFDARALPALQAARLVLVPFAKDADLLAAAGVLRKKVRVVPRSVVLPPCSERPAPRSPFRILFLGGVRPVKGTLAAIELAKALRARGTAVRLQIIGAALDPLHADAVRGMLTPPDDWQAAVSASALPDLLAANDLLLNTSVAEGASNAILEALAHGLPVAARACHGNTEMLRSAPPAAVLLFDAGDVEALSRFVRQLHDGRHVQRGESARNFVAAWHDPCREAAALLSAWTEARSPS